MCAPLLRVVAIPCFVCFLLLFLQQRCLSAALKPSPSILLADDHDDDSVGGLGAGDLVDVVGRDRNITRVRHKRSARVEEQIDDMKQRIKTLEDQLLDLQKFASKQQREKCANALCPVGAVKYGCDCLMYVNRSLKWAQAVDHCATMMGRLVSVTSKGVQKHIYKFLKAQLGADGVGRVQVLTGLIHTTNHSQRPFYTGEQGIKAGADGWYWSSLNKNVRPRFSNWADGQAPSAQSSSDPFPPSCMHLEGAQGLRWVATHCNLPKRFICHFNAVSTHSKRNQKKKKKKQRRARHGGKGRRGDEGKPSRSSRRDRDEEERENG